MCAVRYVVADRAERHATSGVRDTRFGVVCRDVR